MQVQPVPFVALQAAGVWWTGTVTLHVLRPGALCRCYVSDSALQVHDGAATP